MKKVLIVLIVIAIIVIGAGVGYYFYNQNNKKEENVADQNAIMVNDVLNQTSNQVENTTIAEENKISEESTVTSDEQTISAVVKDATMNSLQVTYQGKDYMFSTMTATISTGSKGISIGDTLKITFKGELDSTNPMTAIKVTN